MGIETPPIVAVSGVELASSWNGSSVVALDEFEIVWGRSGLYESPSPSNLRLSVIDPAGDWVTSYDLIGREVTIQRESAFGRLTVCRARITDHSVTRVMISDPGTGRPFPAWRSEITATDARAQLEQLKPSVQLPASTGSTRLAALMEAGANTVVSSIGIQGRRIAVDQSFWYTWLDASELNVAPSIMELIERQYRVHPFGHANYNPHTDGIEVGHPATFTGLSLNYAAGAGLTLSAGAGAVLADAGRFETPKGYTITADVESSVDEVASAWHYRGADANTGKQMWWPINEPNFEGGHARTSQYNPTVRGMRYLEVNAAMHYTSQNWPSNTPKYAGAAEVAVDWRNAINKVNGSFKVPDVRFDFRRHGTTGSTDLDNALLTIYDRPTAIYFVGSVFNALPAVGPAFQIVGGTLAWRSGWVHDVHLAPAMTSKTTPLTLAQIVTNPTPTLADFDPKITLADLGRLATGAA